MQIIWILLVLLFPVPGVGAITVEGVTTAESNIGTPNTLSYSHTIPADVDAVVVCVAERDVNASGYTENTAVVTVGGQSATQLIGEGNGISIRSLLFYRPTPPTGVQTIAVTGDTGNDRLVIATVNLKGVSQSGSFSSSFGVGTTNADVDGLSSGAGELGVQCGAIRTDTVTPSPDATAPVATEQADVAHTDSTSVRVFLYTESGASPSINMRVDLSGAGDWASTAVSLRPLVGSSGRRGVLWFE